MTHSVLKMDIDIVSEIIDSCAKGTVGKILKRIEICADNSSLRAQARELIYEEYRTLKALLMVHAKSINIESTEIDDTILATRHIKFKSAV